MLFRFRWHFSLPDCGVSRIPPVTGGACLTMIVQIDTSEFDRYDEKRDALPKKASVSVVQCCEPVPILCIIPQDSNLSIRERAGF